jgi:hypothetical protein
LLGKLPARTDARTLSFAKYVDRGAIPRPPDRLDLASTVREWPLYANDRLGDSALAAAAHMVEAWTAAAAGKPEIVAEAAVVDAFEQVKVADPTTGEEGAYELDVLKLWRTAGLDGHKIGAFAAVPVHDHRLVRTAASLFGGLYVGIALPLTAQEQQVWDWTKSLSGEAAPGSWGGHAVDVVGYGPDGLAVVTWGRARSMTWAFWDRYVDEAYCVISQELVEGGEGPAGFDLHALREDLERIPAI